MRPFLLLLLPLLAALPARADIYKYVDEQGNVNYTNIPNRLPGKAERVVIEREPSATAPLPATLPAQTGVATGGATPRTRTASPAGFPKVDGDTQRKRDDQRRQILDSELQSEQKALEQARQALSDGKEVRLGGERNYSRYLDRVKELQDAVDTHQANLDALQKEIGNLR